MIVLEASAIIAFLDPADALHHRAVATVIGAGSGPYGVSPITHAEVLVGPTRAETLGRVRAALSALGVREVALAQDAAPRLAALRADARMRLPDCCVLLAALQTDGALLTFDDRLAAAARGLAIDLVQSAS